MNNSLTCPGCARTVAVADHDERKRLRCPACGFVFERPVPPSDAVKAGRPRRPATPPSVQVRAGVPAGQASLPSTQIRAGKPQDLVEPLPDDGGTDDDDGQPYRVTAPEPTCPNCKKVMADDALLCVACGYNVATGELAVREYTPVERFWEGALPIKSRVVLFSAVEAFALLVLAGAVLGDMPVAGAIGWLGCTAVLAFVTGTFDRIDVKRTRAGRVSVKKTWRVCFIPCKPQPIPLRQYAGVTTGMAADADLWDWLVLFTLFTYGIIPGIFYWYSAFHRDQFYVGLVRDHGAMALQLYRGWSETQTREMAQVIRDVAGYQ